MPSFTITHPDHWNLTLVVRRNEVSSNAPALRQPEREATDAHVSLVLLDQSLITFSISEKCGVREQTMFQHPQDSSLPLLSGWEHDLGYLEMSAPALHPRPFICYSTQQRPCSEPSTYGTLEDILRPSCCYDVASLVVAMLYCQNADRQLWLRLVHMEKQEPTL